MGAWRTRWRFSAIALLLGGASCGSSTSVPEQDVLARVDAEPLHTRVVEMVARRDGLTLDEARAKVADTLRWVAAAARDDGSESTELDPAREAHLRRAALARLLLETEFEPRHGPEHVPLDHPLAVRGKSNPRYVRPRLHHLCQLVAVPDVKEPEERERLAADEQWRTRARALFTSTAERLQRNVDASGSADPCTLMQTFIKLQNRNERDVRLAIESKAFDVQACAETAADGTCTRRTFASEWVEQVERASAPGFLPPFETRFGFHLVYLIEVLPERSLDSPEVVADLKRGVHPEWQREKFADYLRALEQKWSVWRADAVPVP